MRRRAIEIGFWAAAFALAPAVARAAEDERVLDRHAAADGSVLTVSVLKGTHLAVRRDGGGGLQLQAQPIADLFPNEEVVAAKATPRAAGDVLLAIVSRHGTENRYRWLTTTGGKDGAWRVSEPVLSEVGEPFRLVEVRNPRGDDVEITFRRSVADAQAPNAPFEEYVFVRAGGSDRLYSSRPLERENEQLEPSDVVSKEPVAPKPAPGGPAPEPEPNPPILGVVTLARSGTVSFDPPGDSAEDPPWADRLDDENRQAKALEGLAAAIAKAASRPERRHADGTSKMRLVVKAEPDVPWRWIQWTLQAAATPPAKVFRVSFGEGPSAVDVDLPLDRGLTASATRIERRTHFVVGLFRRSLEGSPLRTHVVVGEGPDAAGDVVLTDTDRPKELASLADRLRERLSASPLAGVALHAPPPTGGGVPFSDVLDVLRTVRAAGVKDIRLQGAAPPPGKR